MIRLRHKIFIYALRVFDLTIQFLALALIYALSGDRSGTQRIQSIMHGVFGPNDIIGLVILGFGWAAIFNAVVHYEANRLKTLRTQIVDVICATLACAFLLLVVSAMFSLKRVSRDAVVLLWLSTSTLDIIGRLVIRWFLMQVRRSGYNYRHVLILGFNHEALEMARRIDANQVLGYKIVGFITESDEHGSGTPHTRGRQVVGAIDDLQGILERGPIDEMIVCLPLMENIGRIASAVRLAQELGIVVRLFPDQLSAKLLSRLHIERFEGDYVVTLFREQLLMQLLVKRIMDISFSLIGLVVLSPLMLAVAIGIKVTSPGPVLFVQERVGMNKRKFKLYKFRSMYADAETRRKQLGHLNEMDGPVFKIRNDPRITPLGRFIRKFSIDELPQLMNVLRGQMSLVGPRPPLPDEVDRYEWLYRKRLSTKPGITCLWQISGRNDTTFKQWMELDKAYVENWSVWLDLKILFRTIPVVLLGRGAS